jgi:hypothetical protein
LFHALTLAQQRICQCAGGNLWLRAGATDEGTTDRERVYTRQQERIDELNLRIAEAMRQREDEEMRLSCQAKVPEHIPQRVLTSSQEISYLTDFLS